MTSALPRDLARRRGARLARTGAAAVELAIVSPLVILILFGIIEFGRAMTVQQILTNASREGARRAIVESTTAEDVERVVRQYLANSSIGDATVTVTPGNLDAAGFGAPITVTCSVPYDQVSWLPQPYFLARRTLSASSIMSSERLD